MALPADHEAGRIAHPAPVLHVPAVVQAHCTDHILATEFVAGIAVDRLAHGGQPQARRDHGALALAHLGVAS